MAEIRLAKIGSDKKLVLFAMFALQYRVTRLGLCSAYSLLALSITASKYLAARRECRGFHRDCCQLSFTGANIVMAGNERPCK